MSRKRCVRKVWQLVDPIQHAISGASITAQSDLDKLRLLELSAIDAFTRGAATRDDWDAMVDMLNVAETMVSMGIGVEVLQACEAVQLALENALQRYMKSKRLGFSGPEIQSVRDLYEYHDLQRTAVDRSRYEKAIERTRNRIRSAHPSVKIYATGAKA